VRIKVSRAVARTWPALIPDAQRLLDAFEYVCAGLQVEREDKLLDAVVGCRRPRSRELTIEVTVDRPLAWPRSVYNIITRCNVYDVAVTVSDLRAGVGAGAGG
jgi:hypothetical protein